MLKKVWESSFAKATEDKKGVGFGEGKKDLSLYIIILKGLFPRPNSLNLFYRSLSGTAPISKALIFSEAA